MSNRNGKVDTAHFSLKALDSLDIAHGYEIGFMNLKEILSRKKLSPVFEAIPAFNNLIGCIDIGSVTKGFNADDAVLFDIDDFAAASYENAFIFGKLFLSRNDSVFKFRYRYRLAEISEKPPA